MCQVQNEPLPDPKSVLSGTDIPEWVSAAGRQLYDQAAEIASQDYPAYTGPRTATYTDPETGEVSRLTPEEQEANRLLTEGTDVYQGFIDDASAMADTLGQGFETNRFTATDVDSLVGDPFTIESAQPFLDVYQSAVDPAIREIQRQTRQNLIEDSAAAARAGAFGGSRQALREATSIAEGAQLAGDTRAQAAARGLEFASGRFDADRAARFAGEDARRAGFETDEAARRGAFETDEASRLRATETLQSFAPLVQGLQEQAASGLLTAGEARRALDQRALDLAYGDYLEQRQYPMEMLNFALGALQGVPYETRTIGLEQGTQYSQSPSVYGQTLGGLGSLASAYYLGRQ